MELEQTGECETNKCGAENGNVFRGNVQPLLHEIRHALRCWLESGEQTMIDLRGIPMAPGEEDEIITLLGRGEVAAHLSALGSSEISETRYAGVWLVTHRNVDDEITGRYIEITDMPAILKAQQQDMEESLERLSKDLAADEGADSEMLCTSEMTQ